MKAIPSKINHLATSHSKEGLPNIFLHNRPKFREQLEGTQHIPKRIAHARNLAHKLQSKQHICPSRTICPSLTVKTPSYLQNTGETFDSIEGLQRHVCKPTNITKITYKHALENPQPKGVTRTPWHTSICLDNTSTFWLITDRFRGKIHARSCTPSIVTSKMSTTIISERKLR